MTGPATADASSRRPETRRGARSWVTAKAGQARGPVPGRKDEQVQSVDAIGRHGCQHGTGDPCATRGLRSKAPLPPRVWRPDGVTGHAVGWSGHRVHPDRPTGPATGGRRLGGSVGAWGQTTR